MKYPLIAANWKMYKTIKEAEEFALKFKELYPDETDIKVCICAPAPQLQTLSRIFEGTKIGVGAQNCHYEKEGAFTGEISIPMLLELKVNYCIVGHSERRTYFNESDATVNKKVKALLDNNITPIICVGEDLYQREHNYQDKLVAEQVVNAMKGLTPEEASKCVVAYEPIWAIGTGKTATPIQANHMCSVIREAITKMYDDDAVSDSVIIQYGGSVKPESITELMDMEEIDGALVGGASLDPVKFMEIVNF